MIHNAKRKQGQQRHMQNTLLGLESWLISTWRRLLLRKNEDMLATSRMKMGVSFATKKRKGKNMKIGVDVGHGTAHKHSICYMPSMSSLRNWRRSASILAAKSATGGSAVCGGEVRRGKGKTVDEP